MSIARKVSGAAFVPETAPSATVFERAAPVELQKKIAKACEPPAPAPYEIKMLDPLKSESELLRAMAGERAFVRAEYVAPSYVEYSLVEYNRRVERYAQPYAPPQRERRSLSANYPRESDGQRARLICVCGVPGCPAGPFVTIEEFEYERRRDMLRGF